MIIVCSIKTKLTYERHKSRIRFQKLTGGRCVFEDILLLLQNIKLHLPPAVLFLKRIHRFIVNKYLFLFWLNKLI